MIQLQSEIVGEEYPCWKWFGLFGLCVKGGQCSNIVDDEGHVLQGIDADCVASPGLSHSCLNICCPLEMPLKSKCL